LGSSSTIPSGIVVAVIVQALSDRPGAAFGVLAGVAALVLVFA
jgi:hypothetical protein